LRGSRIDLFGFRAATGPAARRDAALLGMMAELGIRVSEALALDLDDFRHNRGHRTVFRLVPWPQFGGVEGTRRHDLAVEQVFGLAK
jgi:integrase